MDVAMGIDYDIISGNHEIRRTQAAAPTGTAAAGST